MKSTMKTLVAALAFGSTLGFASSASASIIDLFAVGTSHNVTDTTNNAVAVVNQFGSDTSIFGGFRDLSINAISGASTTNTAAQAVLAVVGGEGLYWANGTGVRSTAKIQWDGDDSGAVGGVGELHYGLNLNLLSGCGTSACTTLNAIINTADNGFNYSIGIYTDATHWSILSSGTLSAIDDPYTSTYDLAWFNLSASNYILGGLPFTITHGSDGAANLAHVGSLELILSNPNTPCYNSFPTANCKAGIDLQISDLRTVPEPTSLLLFGLGLAGLATLRRRKQA